MKLADSALLEHLVLRNAVMGKSDLNDDTKYLERQYHQHRIEQVLHEGKFL